MKLETAGCLNGVRGVFRPKRAPRSLLGASVCRRSVRVWEFGDEVDSAVVEAVFLWDLRAVRDPVVRGSTVEAEFIVAPEFFLCVRENSSFERIELHGSGPIVVRERGSDWQGKRWRGGVGRRRDL